MGGRETQGEDAVERGHTPWISGWLLLGSGWTNLTVTDGKENGLVFKLCPFKGVASPGKPVNRVIGMLQEIGTFFQRQLVSESHPFVFCHDLVSPLQKRLLMVLD